MRKIKFRGTSLETDDWVYGYLADGNLICTWDNIRNAHEVLSTTVGQFTGLTDKAGREIYEGDIVAHPYIDPIFGDLVEMKDGKGVKSVVVFHEGAFCVRYGEDVFYYLDQFTRHNHIEVIGNVFDNPELMEGGDK